MSGQAENVATQATETVVEAAAAAAPAATETTSIPILLPAASSLYVGDLSQDINETDLFNHFSAAGTVALVRVCRDATRRKSLGYAYVNFLTSQDAEKALTTLNGSLIKNRPCRVLWSQRDASVRKSGVGNVFIKNFVKTATIKDLNELFAQFGKITSSKIACDLNGRSLGHAFVNFSTQEEADAAIAALNNSTYQEKQLFVVKFVPKSERVFPEVPIQAPVAVAIAVPAPLTTSTPPPAAIFQKPVESFTNIFVKNLAEDATEEKLKEVFGTFGEIESAVVSRHIDGALTGKPKGFGFVNFQLHENAVSALEALNGKPLVEGGKALILSKYMKKSEREAAKFRNPHPRRHLNRQHNNQHRQNRQYNNNNNGQVQQRRFHHHNRQHHNNGQVIPQQQQSIPQHHQGARHHQRRHHNNQQQQGVNLYVKGFEATVTEQILKDSFIAFGAVLGTRVMKDENGVSRGFGFVTLKTAEEAQKAIAEMNGQRIQASQVTVAVAHRKEHNNQRHRHNHNHSHNHHNNRNGKRHYNNKRNNQAAAVAPVESVEQSVEEQVYFKLEAINSELAGQITGMIIEEYTNKGASLAELVVDEALLKEKYNLALEVLNAANAAAAAAAAVEVAAVEVAAEEVKASSD